MSRINLFPWREQQRLQRKRRFILLCITAIILVFILIAALSFWLFKLKNTQQQQQQQVQQLQLKKQQQLIRLKKSNQFQLATYQQQRFGEELSVQHAVNARLFDELALLTPSQIYITQIKQQDQQWLIQGLAANKRVAQQYSKKLQTSSWWDQAQLLSYQNTTLTKKSDKNNLDHYGRFELQLDLAYAAQPSLAWQI